MPLVRPLKFSVRAVPVLRVDQFQVRTLFKLSIADGEVVAAVIADKAVSDAPPQDPQVGTPPDNSKHWPLLPFANAVGVAGFPSAEA